MTLIVAFGSNEFAIMVSDRALTWTYAGDAKAHREVMTKATIYHDRSIIGFTGAADLGPDGRTDDWIVDALTVLPEGRFPGGLVLPLEKAHRMFTSPFALMAVGWGGSLGMSAPEPRLYEVSNREKPEGWARWGDRSPFRAHMPNLNPVGDFKFWAVGMPPPRSAALKVVAEIRRRINRHPDRCLEIAKVMTRMVWAVVDSRSDGAVGSTLTVTIMPKASISSNFYDHRVTGQIVEPLKATTCVQWSRDGTTRFHGVNIVERGSITKDFEVEIGGTGFISPRNPIARPIHPDPTQQ